MIVNRPERNEESMDLNDMSNYDLGILWSVGTYDGERFVVRHKDRYYPDRIAAYLGNTVYEQMRTHKPGDNDFVIKSSGINLKQLYGMGWTDRSDDVRHLPVLDDYMDFIRAYTEIHSSLDYSTRHSRYKTKYKSLRLRIYGNTELISDINRILTQSAGVSLKAPQVLDNNKTAVLYYQRAAEVRAVYDWLSGDPCNSSYWDDVKHKLDQPTKSY